MYPPVETVRTIEGQRVHRFQVVREHRDDGTNEEWIVVGFTGGRVRLASADFGWTREVDVEAFEGGRFEPLAAGDVPVWGY